MREVPFKLWPDKQDGKDSGNGPHAPIDKNWPGERRFGCGPAFQANKEVDPDCRGDQEILEPYIYPRADDVNNRQLGIQRNKRRKKENGN